jgi:predicted permease
MPTILTDVINLLGALVRLLGLVVLGYGMARFALDAYRKGVQTWQLQAIVFLGFVGLVAALANYTSAAGLGGFGLGAGVAFLLGLRSSDKTE